MAVHRTSHLAICLDILDERLQGEIPITIKRPSCPNDYYVLGHLALRSLNGTNIAEVPMPEYQCIHESLLRKGSWRSAPIFTGSQPSTSPWNPKLINSEWKEPLSLWQVDCRKENCGSDPYCQDSFSAGGVRESACERA